VIRPINVLVIARGLRSQNHENPEYDRALIDMLSDLLSIDRDMAEDLILGEGTIQ